MQRVSGLGEPWLTFFRPDELRARVHDLGFTRVAHLSAAETNARYCDGRSDGMRMPPYIGFISATV
jgi:hypothetical protein